MIKRKIGEKEIIYVNKMYEVEEINGIPQKTHSYYYANGERAAERVTTIATNESKVYYYHNDHLGGTNLVTDESGNQTSKVEYYPFGETSTGSTPFFWIVLALIIRIISLPFLLTHFVLLLWHFFDLQLF